MTTDLNEKILSTPLGGNDAGAATVRDYILELATQVWVLEDSFSSKRPFGNSDWQDEIYGPLIKAGLIPGKLDDDGVVESVAVTDADRLIADAIRSMKEPSRA